METTQFFKFLLVPAAKYYEVIYGQSVPLQPVMKLIVAVERYRFLQSHLSLVGNHQLRRIVMIHLVPQDQFVQMDYLRL